MRFVEHRRWLHERAIPADTCHGPSRRPHDHVVQAHSQTSDTHVRPARHSRPLFSHGIEHNVPQTTTPKLPLVWPAFLLACRLCSGLFLLKPRYGSSDARSAAESAHSPTTLPSAATTSTAAATDSLSCPNLDLWILTMDNSRTRWTETPKYCPRFRLHPREVQPIPSFHLRPLHDRRSLAPPTPCHGSRCPSSSITLPRASSVSKPRPYSEARQVDRLLGPRSSPGSENPITFFSAVFSRLRLPNHWICGTLSMLGGQIAEWVPIIFSAVGLHKGLLDQAPQLPQENRDALLQELFELLLFHLVFFALCSLLSRPAQVSILPPPPRNAFLPDDRTARGGPARLTKEMLQRRPRRSWRCRGCLALTWRCFERSMFAGYLNWRGFASQTVHRQKQSW